MRKYGRVGVGVEVYEARTDQKPLRVDDPVGSFQGPGLSFAIFPSLMPISALNHGFPVPSIIRPFLMTISKYSSSTDASIQCKLIRFFLLYLNLKERSSASSDLLALFEKPLEVL